MRYFLQVLVAIFQSIFNVFRNDPQLMEAMENQVNPQIQEAQEPQEIVEEVPVTEPTESIEPTPLDSTKNYYVVCGINKYNPLVWGSCNLGGCVNDAKGLEKIARSKGFEGTLLLDKDVTSAAFKKSILELVEKAETGSTVLIAYSGHGTFSDSGKERITGICVQDRVIWDYETKELLSKFGKGVRVVWISDSCYSEGNYKVAPISTKRKWKVKFVQKPVGMEPFENVEDPIIKCQVVAFMSSQDSETSCDGTVGGKPQGAFIGSLCLKYAPDITYAGLFNLVNSYVIKNWPQHPKLELLNLPEQELKTPFLS